MTAVLPIYHRSEGPPHDTFQGPRIHWIFSRGLVLRALVALFLLWNLLAFPHQAAPHSWMTGVILGVIDVFAWYLWHRHPQEIELWIIISAAFDLLLGLVALTQFSTTIESDAPALLPIIGIELIAYWGWVGYWIAMTYTTIAIIVVWPTPAGQVPIALNHLVFWLAVNFFIISAVALMAHRDASPNLPATSLTPREQEVYTLLQSGMTQRDIAEKLHIERSTVKTHVQHIHHKLGLGDPPPEE